MIDRNYQCGYELLNDGMLVISKYDNYWQNESYFITTNGELYQSIFTNTNDKTTIGNYDMQHTSVSAIPLDNSTTEDVPFQSNYDDELELSQGGTVSNTCTNR